MNAMIKTLSSALLIGLFLAGAVVVMSSWRNFPVDAAPQDASTLVPLPAVETIQVDTLQGDTLQGNILQGNTAQVDSLQVDVFQVDATIAGTVDLAWGATGAYSDTLPAAERNVLSDTVTMDLVLLLEKGAGDTVTGYVDVQNSLVFTTENVISTTVASTAAVTVTTEVGPKSSGSFAGNQLNLLSERVSYTTEAGQTVERQFRLTAAPNPGSALLTGEYRETVWGLSLRPMTIGGTFVLTELRTAPADTNRAPEANPQTVTTQANTAKAITLTGSDADNDALTYTIIADPTRGTLSGTAPNMIYTPSAGFAGSDSFTFRVSDGKVDSDAVPVSIIVEDSTNRPPTAGDDAATTTAGVAVTINVLDNDLDPDGDALTVTITQQPQNGIAQVNGVTIVYTPNANFSGTDSLTYAVTDSKSATTGATITITVQAQANGGTIYLPLIDR